MSENKRFVWSDKTCHGYVIDTETIEHLSHYSCMVKLNELNNENNDLKKKNKYFLKLIFALKNYAEMGDLEKIDNIINKIKKEMI